MTFRSLLFVAAGLLSACGTTSPRPPVPASEHVAPPAQAKPGAPPAQQAQLRTNSIKAREVVIYALMLHETGYRFGGKNPKAGIDCSGLVTYVYWEGAGMPLQGNAASLARQGRAVSRKALRPGDLVFFNTRNRPFSHVGIYLGEDKFIHALNETAGVRIDRLSQRYYAKRYEGGRTFFG